MFRGLFSADTANWWSQVAPPLRDCYLGLKNICSTNLHVVVKLECSAFLKGNAPESLSGLFITLNIQWCAVCPRFDWRKRVPFWSGEYAFIPYFTYKVPFMVVPTRPGDSEMLIIPAPEIVVRPPYILWYLYINSFVERKHNTYL